MNIFKINKFKFFARVFLIYSLLFFGLAYLFAYLAYILLDIEISYEPFMIVSILWFLVIVLSLFDSKTTIKINKNNIKRTSPFGVGEIKCNEITKIKFNYLLRTLTLLQDKHRIIVGSFYEQYDTILLLIHKMLLVHEKTVLEPLYMTKKILK